MPTKDEVEAVCRDLLDYQPCLQPDLVITNRRAIDAAAAMLRALAEENEQLKSVPPGFLRLADFPVDFKGALEAAEARAIAAEEALERISSGRSSVTECALIARAVLAQKEGQ